MLTLPPLKFVRTRKPLTQERLKELLHYDPETGVFTWKVDRYCGKNYNRLRTKAGDTAGCLQSFGSGTKYITIRIDGRLYLAHRLAWFMITGEWVPLLDHKDGDGENNRLDNLRRANKKQNSANSKKPSTNTSGFKGVYFSKAANKWVAQIRLEDKTRYLGLYATAKEAHSIYMLEAGRHFGEFARAS